MPGMRQRFIDRHVAEGYISETVLSLLIALGIPVIRATTPVTYKTGSGLIEIPFGQCTLKADATGLSLSATASYRPKLDKTIEVITSHLDRFAFRESPELSWTISEGG